MAGEFRECRLTEMYREVTIVVASPGESGAEEVINVTHKVDFDFVLEKFLEQVFFSLAGGVENEIINIKANADGGTVLGVGGGIWVGEDASVEAGIVLGGRKVHALEDGRDHIVPVVGRMTEAI